MHIIIIGAGDVGLYISKELIKKGHIVTLIEKNEDVFLIAKEQLDAKILLRDGALCQALIEAGAHNADYCLSLTSKDKTNLVACFLAKILGTKKTIARVHDSVRQDNEYINYQIHFGIDAFVDPEHLCAVELAKTIRNPGKIAVENFANTKVEMHHVIANENSDFIEDELQNLPFSKNSRVAYIQHNQKIEIANKHSIIKKGDEVVIVGTADTNFDIENKININEHSLNKKSIVIYGGTETAISLIRLLKKTDCTIRIIEKKTEICQKLAATFDHITVIQGDATSLYLLQEEQIHKADYFLACTKDDENNIMTAIQAKKLGVNEVSIVINSPNYENLVNDLKDKLGIQNIVSPRVSTLNEIQHYVTDSPYTEISSLQDNETKIIQLEVPIGFSYKKQSIQNIPWPKDMLILALIHKFEAIVPSAKDCILEGDRLLIIIKKDKIKEMETIFFE